jgi:O-acetylserine/cysteine efflux transporter
VSGALVSPRLTFPHFLLALLIVAIWGTNFVVIHRGLAAFPPITFGALRFLVASLPFLAFVRWPGATVATVAGYGVLIGLGQFGLLFYAMAGHVSPGLASLVVQVQAFFTVALAALVTRERPRLHNLLALLLAGAGIALIASHIGGDADAIGLLLVLGAALGWAGGNIVAKRAGRIDMLGLMVWSSLFAVPPLLALALVVEGPSRIGPALAAAGPAAWATVLWQAVGNTLFGYGAWNWLLARYPAAQIAPLALMVPVFGMSASALLLGEPLPGWKLVAAAMVIGGLAVNILGGARPWAGRLPIRTRSSPPPPAG